MTSSAYRWHICYFISYKKIRVKNRGIFMLQVGNLKAACNRIFEYVFESSITCSRIEMYTSCNRSNMLCPGFHLINFNLRCLLKIVFPVNTHHTWDMCLIVYKSSWYYSPILTIYGMYLQIVIIFSNIEFHETCSVLLSLLCWEKDIVKLLAGEFVDVSSQRHQPLQKLVA